MDGFLFAMEAAKAASWSSYRSGQVMRLHSTWFLQRCVILSVCDLMRFGSSGKYLAHFLPTSSTLTVFVLKIWSPSNKTNLEGRGQRPLNLMSGPPKRSCYPMVLWPWEVWRLLLGPWMLYAAQSTDASWSTWGLTCFGPIHLWYFDTTEVTPTWWQGTVRLGFGECILCVFLCAFKSVFLFAL